MKSNKPRDIKFIIYQSLYILVVCIIAIKGASLDLAPVDLRDSTLLKPKYAYMYIDTSANRVVSKKEFEKYIPYDSTKYVILTRSQFSSLAPKDMIPPPIASVIQNPITYTPLPENYVVEQPPTHVPDVGVKFPSNFTQYYANTITNGNSIPLLVKTLSGSVTIPEHGTKEVILEGDKTVTLVAGNESKTYSVKENQIPKINMQNLVPLSGEEISLKTIESETGYRITITDDYANQLSYKITGPLTYKEVRRTENEIVLDVKLNFIGSSSAFDRYAELHPNENIYSVSFSIDVKDKIAPHSVNQIGVFRFTKW